MKTRVTYSAFLDLLLFCRQIHEHERFKPFRPFYQEAVRFVSARQIESIRSIGDQTRNWLELLEWGIQKAGIDRMDMRELLSELKSSDREEFALCGTVLEKLWLGRIGNAIHQRRGAVSGQIEVLENHIRERDSIEWLLSCSDRMEQKGNGELCFHIKPPLRIHQDQIISVLIQPSLFASRDLTFWHTGSSFLFYLPLDQQNRDTVPAPSDMIQLFTRAISDPTRLKMLYLLNQNDHSLQELAGTLDVNVSTVSRHAKLFKDSGLANVGEREDHSLEYSFRLKGIEEGIERLISWLNNGISS